ncbi:hypothetical protein [Parapusillimonas granuli]|uniref:Uncharacterized protein n=1 Tax=Parapusillimonas granuli TaxID=380911 RepID=A0A853G082_9BURK|nr:hypothetical protein [Parapusillimonas granuli]MBB5216973.1 hypothetical protein [Parapusillimonas granuli]MEB2400697.1 hypothetical protein [Alcaligenaceae bacterium]NYT50263.1 hypothetical protein [Parapusillimonas granuli]
MESTYNTYAALQKVLALDASLLLSLHAMNDKEQVVDLLATSARQYGIAVGREAIAQCIGEALAEEALQ